MQKVQLQVPVLPHTVLLLVTGIVSSSIKRDRIFGLTECMVLIFIGPFIFKRLPFAQGHVLEL